jgi:sigma-70-like protein
VKAAAGDEAEFVAFVQARQHRLLRSAYLICGDRHLAEDLLQGALVKLALHWTRVRTGDPEAFRQPPPRAPAAPLAGDTDRRGMACRRRMARSAQTRRRRDR